MTCFRPDGHLTDAALTALVRGDCLEELAKKHYHAISARLSISQEEVRSAERLIRELNPPSRFHLRAPQRDLLYSARYFDRRDGRTFHCPPAEQ